VIGQLRTLCIAIVYPEEAVMYVTCLGERLPLLVNELLEYTAVNQLQMVVGVGV